MAANLLTDGDVFVDILSTKHIRQVTPSDEFFFVICAVMVGQTVFILTLFGYLLTSAASPMYNFILPNCHWWSFVT